ncbi:MAG: DNA repair protein RecO [Parcubacteria group bacterium]|nr:DNA repair protein RecO [Parcubacteria group bacterium]
MHLCTQAMILKKKDVFERDRLYTMFARSLGKIQVLARGVRKRESKLSPFLQEMALLDIAVVRRKNQGMLLTEVMIRNNCHDTKRDIRKIALSQYCCEAAEKMTVWHVPEANVFETLWDVLRYIDRIPKQANFVMHQLQARVFVWKLTEHLGFSPPLGRCAECKSSFSERDFYLDVKQNSVLCEQHRSDEGIPFEHSLYASMMNDQRFTKDAMHKRYPKKIRLLADAIDAMVEKNMEFPLQSSQWI